MNFAEAAETAATRLTSDDQDELAEAALHLALQAWQAAPATDPRWNWIGLELPDVRSRLYPTPQVEIASDPPAGDAPEIRAVVGALVKALADRHRRVAGDSQRPLVQWLEHDGVAVQPGLRRSRDGV